MNLWQRAGKAYKALEAHRKKARERIRELKAENARLRGALRDCELKIADSIENSVDLEMADERIAELEEELSEAVRYYDNCASYREELKADNARLRGVIKDAPHSLGCAGLYDKNAPTWMRPGKCNCWKRDALAEKDDG